VLPVTPLLALTSGGFFIFFIYLLHRALCDTDLEGVPDTATEPDLRVFHSRLRTDMISPRCQRRAERAADRGAERAARAGRGVVGDSASVSLSVSVRTLGGERRRRSMTGGGAASVLFGSVASVLVLSGGAFVTVL
jgi:hypothetical protein